MPRKYVGNLRFMLWLGYDTDFGHMEVLALLNSDGYSKKHIDRLFISALIPVNPDLMKGNTWKQGRASKNLVVVSLALHRIANVAPSKFADSFKV